MIMFPFYQLPPTIYHHHCHLSIKTIYLTQ
jgi:hypothetical protein